MFAHTYNVEKDDFAQIKDEPCHAGRHVTVRDAWMYSVVHNTIHTTFGASLSKFTRDEVDLVFAALVGAIRSN